MYDTADLTTELPREYLDNFRSSLSYHKGILQVYKLFSQSWSLEVSSRGHLGPKYIFCAEQLKQIALCCVQ